MTTNLLSRYAAVVLGLLLTAATGFSKNPTSRVQITVRLMDYAKLRADALREVQAHARRILSGAGIEAEFVECLVGQTLSDAPVCQTALGPADFVLRIMDARRALKGTQLGYASATEAGGAYVTVFVNPEQRRARVNSLSEGVLLGHATAHELGHLLLGPNSHTGSGIMRPFWSRTDEEWMVKGALQFDGQQAKRMRASLLARVAQ